MKRSVVLFSGGIDSTTALYWARARADEVRALTFDYGQRHKVEVRMARLAARRLGVPHTILKIDLTPIGGSALTDAAVALPRYRKIPPRASGPPVTYVPFRNGILIAVAAAWAEAAARRSSAASTSSTHPITRTRARSSSGRCRRRSTPGRRRRSAVRGSGSRPPSSG
jgi:queuosine biosynthesis protein QueC